MVYVIINSYRSGLVIETEILLSTLRIVAISPKTPIPNRIVVIETISSLISNPDILEFICKNCVNNENVSDICAAVIPNPNELLLSSITAPEGVNRLNRLLSTEDLPYKLEEAFSQAARSKYIDAVEKLGALDVTEINAIPQACDYVHTLILSLSKLFDPRGSCHDVDTCPSFNSESLSKLLDKLEDFFVNVFKLPLPHSSLLSLLDDLYSLSILIWERPPGALQDQCLKLFQSAYKDNFLKAHNAGIHPENLLASAGTLAKTPPLEDNDSSSSHKKDQDEVVAPSQATEVRVFIISKMSDFILAFKSAISDSQWEHILTFLEFITNLLNINIIQPKDAHLDNLVECTSGISQRYQKCVSRGEAQDTPVNLDNGIGGAIDPAILKHFGCLLSRIISGGDYKAVIRIVKAASETSKKIIRLSALQDPPEANLSSKRIHIMCVFYIKFIWKLTLLNLEKIAKDEDTDLYFDISLVFGHYSNNLEPQNLFDIALRAHISITNSFISYTGRSENTRLYLKVLSSAKLTCFHNVFSYVEFTGTRDWDEILHYPTRSSPDTHEVFRHVWMLRVLCIFLRHPKLLKFLAKELYKIMEDCASVYMPTLCTVRYGPYIKDDIDQMLFTTKNYYKLSRLIYNFIKDSLSSEYLPDHLNIMERARCIILGISLESSDIVNVVNFMRLMYVLLRSLFEVYAQKSEHELSINISGIQIRDIKKVNPGIMLFNDINSPRKNNALRKVVIAATDKHILNNLLCNCVYSILKYTLHSLPEIRLLAFNSLFNLMDKYFLYISDTNLKLKIADILLSMTGYHIGLPSSSGVDLSFGCRCTYKSEPLTEVAKIGDPANFDNIGTIISRTSSIICQMLDTLSEPHAQMSELCNKIVDIAEECFYNYTKDVSVTSLHALETILELESLRNTVFAHCASKIRMKIFETCKNISQSIDTSGERIFLAPDNDRMVLTKVVCTPYQILVLMGVFVIAYSALPENQFLENFGTATDIITTFLKCPIIMAVTGHPQSFYDSTKLKNNYVCMPSNLHKKAEDLLSRLSVDRNKNKLVPGFASKVLSSIHSEIMLTTNNPSAGPTNVFSREYMQINCVSAAKQFMRSLQKSVVHIARYSGPSMAVPISSTIDNLVDFISFEGNEAVANGELDLIDLAEDSLYTMCNIIESVIVNIRGDDISSIITSDDIKYIHSKITAPHSPLFQSIRRSLRNKKNVNLTDDVVELFLNATRDIISYFCQTSNVSEDLSELGSLVKTLVDGTTVYYTHSSIYGELSPESIDFFNTSAPYCVVLPQKNLIIGCYSVVEELCSRYKKFNDRNVRIASELAARALYKKSRATLLDLVNNISIHDGIPLSDIQYTELLLILESLLRIRVIPGALRDYFSNNKDGKMMIQAL